ncbi:hypothetical protein GO003_013875 [Methylicorpusculum oleiharenae]|uniref:hypothetical protein n=1 Tax=Methylicorpusculum oleiharenae TaxID=1338687 RepID=UPI0019D0EB5E|nr:hypothetical protein [Methylicorpusculum oleiharenae]MCD2451479.1 hypothetical protein [Methylicorpusculum oleiharenae]
MIQKDVFQQTSLNQIENLMVAKIIAHDIPNGCTMAESFGTELILPLNKELATGALTTIAVSSNEIALSLGFVQGISIQNQIRGRICTLISGENGVLVQIDCGNIWVAGVSLKASRDMNLREGISVYCLAKTVAFSYRPEIVLSKALIRCLTID